MKKLLLISMVAIIVLTVMAPAALAWTPPPLKGNTTNVTVYGRNNFSQVMVQGAGNATNLYIAPRTKFNMTLVGVMGCGNKTNVKLGYGAKYNTTGVMVYSPCP